MWRVSTSYFQLVSVHNHIFEYNLLLSAVFQSLSTILEPTDTPLSQFVFYSAGLVIVLCSEVGCQFTLSNRLISIICGLTPTLLSFLRRYSHWEHFLNTPSVLFWKLFWASKIVPRYLASTLWLLSVAVCIFVLELEHNIKKSSLVLVWSG